MSNIKVTFVRRREGIEVTLTGDAETPEALEEAAAAFIDAIEQVDGAPGYRNKREITDEDKARRKSFAIKHSITKNQVK